MLDEGLGMHFPPLTPGPIFPAPYGRYVLLDKIGEGGMAEVFRAAVLGPAGFQRILVIKRILSSISQDQSFVSMFIDEANLCARLSHPNIVQIYDFGKVADTYFIAMEHVMGRNVSAMMSKVVRTHRLLPPTVAADIARQVCLGLDYAHTLRVGDRPLGIVHRDVSPTNIMVAYTGAVKVLDFGIARAVEGRETSTRSGVLKGKIAYLAPEQIHFGPFDCRVDIFAMGIVLYEMLAGRRLFRANNDLQMMKMIMEMAIPPLATQNPEVKPDLDRIVMRALERDPNLRYSSAAEMASDLEGYLLDERHSAKATSHFIEDLFSDEISCTPTSEMATDKLIEMMRAVTHKGFPVMDPAGAARVPLGTARAIVVDDRVCDPRTVVPGAEGPRPGARTPEGLACDPRGEPQARPDHRLVDSTVAIRSPSDPLFGEAFFGPSTPAPLSIELQPQDPEDSEIADSAADSRIRESKSAGASEASSQYLDLSITRRESNATVSSLLRAERILRNRRLGRIAAATGLVAASLAILLAAAHHADRRHGSPPGHPDPYSPAAARPSLLGSLRAESQTHGSQRGFALGVTGPGATGPASESKTLGSKTLVQILLDSVPQDATIMRENREVGTTPAAVYLPRGTEVVRLAVARAGYATASVRVIPDLDKPVLVTLRPLRAKTDRPRSARSARNLGERTTHQAESSQRSGENVRRAIPVDPFGL